MAAKRILALKRRPCPRTHRLSPPGVDSVTISFRRHSWHIQTHFHWTKQSFYGAKSISIQLPAAQRLRPHHVRNALVTTRIAQMAAMDVDFAAGIHAFLVAQGLSKTAAQLVKEAKLPAKLPPAQAAIMTFLNAQVVGSKRTLECKRVDLEESAKKKQAAASDSDDSDDSDDDDSDDGDDCDDKPAAKPMAVDKDSDDDDVRYISQPLWPP